MDNWLGLDARPRMNAEQAETYERKRARGRSRELTQSLIKLTLFYCAYVLADIALLGDVTWLSITLRFGVIVPLAILVHHLLRGPQRIIVKEYAMLALAVLGNLVWCIITVASDNPLAIQYYYAAVLFQMVVTIGVRAPFRASLAATLACFVINYSFIAFVNGGNAMHTLYHLAFYLPAVLQTLIASYQLEAERQINFLQMHENERLKHELSRQNDALEQLAVTDPLTQLPNRRGTDAAVAQMRQDQAGNLPSAVLIIDIDHFKAYNDGYGHQVGDDCLQQVAAAMRRELPETAHLARHGGEEFLAILPGCDTETTIRHAESLRRAVRAEAIEHVHRGDRYGHITVSIGAACGLIPSKAGLENLIAAADEALYQVKADGRNGWRLAETTEMGRKITA